MMVMTRKVNGAAERLTKMSGESYKRYLDHVVGLQERNMRFFQESVEKTARELHHQAESNRALTQELVERAEKQRDAFQTLVEESLDAYMDLLYAPLAYWRQGLRLVEEAEVVPVLPIAGYDEMNVAEIREKAEGLNAAQIRQLREYEKANKNRASLIEYFDGKLKAVSA
ncbi:MAG: hypothetical protein AB1425_12745 [Actinomycetota bacterium]